MDVFQGENMQRQKQNSSNDLELDSDIKYKRPFCCLGLCAWMPKGKLQARWSFSKHRSQNCLSPKTYEIPALVGKDAGNRHFICSSSICATTKSKFLSSASLVFHQQFPTALSCNTYHQEALQLALR